MGRVLTFFIGKKTVFARLEFDEWQLTPKWHPRYWFGYRVRRWIWEGYSIGQEYDGEWEYLTHLEHAHLALRSISGGHGHGTATG